MNFVKYSFSLWDHCSKDRTSFSLSPRTLISSSYLSSFSEYCWQRERNNINDPLSPTSDRHCKHMHRNDSSEKNERRKLHGIEKELSWPWLNASKGKQKHVLLTMSSHDKYGMPSYCLSVLVEECYLVKRKDILQDCLLGHSKNLYFQIAASLTNLSADRLVETYV